MDFSQLISVIQGVHDDMQANARSAINRSLTIRNWLIGYYIVEFEQNGQDRAQYGEGLLQNLSASLQRHDLDGLSYRNLKLFRQFYQAYPQLGRTPSVQLQIERDFSIGQTSAQSESGEGNFPIGQTSAQFESGEGDPPIGQTSAQFQNTDGEFIASDGKARHLGLSPEIVLYKLSFSHLVELTKLDESLQRAFYEIECVKCGWSVRELKRNIESLFYERTGLSKDKQAMSKLAAGEELAPVAAHFMRDPYVFEFLGLRQQDIVLEEGLRNAILDHLQQFILEMGKGFCFEAREKRILVDDEYHFIDLVFYHRILKCHVLIDLKTRKFTHVDAGQLNFYLNYYKDNELEEGDNPPIGMLLCTSRQKSTVKYATGGMDNQLFISQYKVALPSEEQLIDFLERDQARIEETLARQARD